MPLSQVKSQDPSTRLVMTYRQLLSAIKAALQTLGYDQALRHPQPADRPGNCSGTARIQADSDSSGGSLDQRHLPGEYIQLTPDHLQRISGLIGEEGAAGRLVFGGLSPDEACKAEIDTIDS